MGRWPLGSAPTAPPAALKGRFEAKLPPPIAEESHGLLEPDPAGGGCSNAVGAGAEAEPLATTSAVGLADGGLELEAGRDVEGPADAAADGADGAAAADVEETAGPLTEPASNGAAGGVP